MIYGFKFQLNAMDLKLFFTELLILWDELLKIVMLKQVRDDLQLEV